ncbi:SCO2400 family protein [Streptomyces lincolnensis]|uniref:SCO2400 family protein n=1 Tax=Streptomyces lincolnensis TaxID=1915 RepID=UPI0037D8F251
MDYCSSCRRHLNGALVCPGCGAYAPDIAPATADHRIAPATVAMTAAPAAAPDSTAWDAWYDGRPYDEAGEPGGTGEPAVDTDGVPIAPEGRAARRRQRARWKKNQRRAVVATAVALVGGGLTLASMDRQSGDQTQAATAPVDPGTGVEEQTAQVSGPAGTQPEARHATSTPARSASAGHESGRYVTASQSTTTSNAARTDSASAPRETTGSTSQVRSAVTSATDTVARATGTTGTTNTTGTTGTSGTSGSTATTPAQTPTDTATSGTGSGSSGSGTSGSGTGASQSDSSTSATSPSGICVLGLLCIS